MVVRAGGAALRNSRGGAESPSNGNSSTGSTSGGMRRAAAATGALAAAEARSGQRRWATAAATTAAAAAAAATTAPWQPPSSLLRMRAAAVAHDRRGGGGFGLFGSLRRRPLATASAAAAEAAAAAAPPAASAAAAAAAADAPRAALPAAGDYAALRRLTQLHNTMSRVKEPFVPASISPARPPARLVSPDRKTAPGAASSSSAAAAADAAFAAAEANDDKTTTTTPSRPKVNMYVCGVTVYDLSHIGHARAYVAFDVLLRLLSRACGYDVRYVRNFTDVDDKIIARAARLRAEQQQDSNGGGGGAAAAAASGSDNGIAAADEPSASTPVSAEDALALASRFIDEFRADMESLGCLPPTDEPRATEYIPQMVDTIGRIISHGHAYAAADGSGDVFFDVRSLPGYGLLSGRTDASVNRAGASDRVAVDPRKRDAADFALWKGAKAGEPSWPSPWGPGRPGWHIECSAMIRAVLGEGAIDIHGGGRDLVFPHHENELAQSRAALAPCACCEPATAAAMEEGGEGEGGEAETVAVGTATTPTRRPNLPPPEERDFARYWVHNGFVNVDSEKMSKSLGNFFTIRDAAHSHGAPVLRWLLVGSHYRQPLQYTQRALDEAADRLYYVYQALADADAALAEAAAAAAAEAAAPVAAAAADANANGGKKKKAAPAKDLPIHLQADALSDVLAGQGPGGALASAASAALADDLGTPAAVGALSPALKALNDLLHTRAGRRAAGRAQSLASYRAGLSYVLDDLLGFPTREPEGQLAALRQAALSRAGLTEAALRGRVAARAEARAAKDFAAADAVRAELAAKGVFLMDAASGGGSAWRPGVPEGAGEEGASA